VFFVLDLLISILLVGLGLINVVLPSSGVDFVGGIVLSVPAAVYAISECIAFCRRKVRVERVLGFANLGIATLPALGVIAFVIGSFTQDDPRMLPPLTWRLSVGSCFAVVSGYFIASGWCRLRWTR